MLNATSPLINLEYTQNSQENQNNNNCVLATNGKQYLRAEKHDHTTTSSALASCSVIDLTDHTYSINQHNKQNTTTQSTDYTLVLTTQQNILENAIHETDKSVAKQAIKSLVNNSKYPHLFIDILNNYLIQNKTSTLKKIFFDYNVCTENILYYLLQDQLNGEKNIVLIKTLINKGARLTITDIEFLLESNDDLFIKNQLQILTTECTLLHDILNEAVNLDKLEIITKLYSTYGFATLESLNYLLQNLFVTEFNVELFNNLIEEGATITETTLKKLVLSEDINQINNIVSLLANHKLYNTILTSILNIATKQNKIAIVQMLYNQYNFFTASSLDYMLLHNLKNTFHIDTINKLLELGALISNNDLAELLTNSTLQVTGEQFVDFYLQLEQINFNNDTKKIIRFLLKQQLKQTKNIMIEGDTLTIISWLYFNHCFITQSSLDYILAYEPQPKNRYLAEIMFKQKYKYKQQLEDIVNNF